MTGTRIWAGRHVMTRRIGIAGLPLALAAGAAIALAPVGCDDEPSYDPYGSRPPLAEHWPRFRGPGGLAVSDETGLPVTWDEQTGQNVLWKTAIPLPGASSPVVLGDRVFLSGGGEVELRPGEFAQRREVYCFDASSGALLWTRQVNAPGGSPEQEYCYEDITWAAPTVVTDGVCVFAIFGNGDVCSFDYDGRAVWVRNLGLPRNGYGHSSSLALHGDLLIVQLDQQDAMSRLVALNKRNGRTVWEKAGPERPVGISFSTPIVIEAAGKAQLVTCAPPLVSSHDPSTGEPIWSADCLGASGEVVVSPIYAGGFVIAVGMEGIVAVRPDGTGDVTSSHVVWKTTDGMPGVSSPVGSASGQGIFTVAGWAIVRLRVSDGAVSWSQSLSGQGLSFNASPVRAGDRVYAQSTEGVMVVFRDKDGGYEELGRGYVNDVCYASPALAQGRIYLRGKQCLYCIGGN